MSANYIFEAVHGNSSYCIEIPLGSSWLEIEAIICKHISLSSPLILFYHDANGDPIFVSDEKKFSSIISSKVNKVHVIACKSQDSENEKNVALRQLLQRATLNVQIYPEANICDATCEEETFVFVENTISENDTVCENNNKNKVDDSTTIKSENNDKNEVNDLTTIKSENFENAPNNILRRSRSFNFLNVSKSNFEKLSTNDFDKQLNLHYEFPSFQEKSLQKGECSTPIKQDLRSFAVSRRNQNTSTSSKFLTIYKNMSSFFYYLFNIFLLIFIMSTALTYILDPSYEFQFLGFEYQASKLPFIELHHLKFYDYELTCLCVMTIKICV